MKAIFEYLQALAGIEFLLVVILIMLFGWIAIAWQDYRKNKDIAKRLEKENEWFKKRYGHKK